MARKDRIKQLEANRTQFSDRLNRHRSDTDVIRQRWLQPLKDLIGRISGNFSKYFAAMRCAGMVSLSEPQNLVSAQISCSTCSVVLISFFYRTGIFYIFLVQCLLLLQFCFGYFAVCTQQCSFSFITGLPLCLENLETWKCQGIS